ncbi:unnamed protein product [Rotaria magnacalcarata]|uniref:Ionotropic glutamate receptor C-terminal domain-containing protein n=1 Tax=Rotaria magnacalcarata TaxID=392030 RepID=A0A815RQR3_9BILA|nr:unnamed protein product [Rotaria magnacalcarata]CAF1623771.1 unnamed protein product [Rotaria magnacalcarata]CAF2172869.1 unnamed protein product [Rotaria magnacalcarata]CAF3767737.1 unnamed protein product [Rotaria magnacalcarata]CAF3797536.1 unnamed protein product [Rotaria magnacalcarata]
MQYLWDFQYFFFTLLFELLSSQYATKTWLSSNFSSLQLLGLFEDVSNSSNSTDFAVHSLAMFKAAILLSHQYNITVDGEYIGWQTVQTKGNVIDSLSSSCLAVSTEKIIGIVGPIYSREAHIIAAFANRIGIPVISFSATDPDLTDRNTYPAFFRTVPPDDIAALSIAQLFIQFNWTSCIIIYQNDNFGTNGAKALAQVFNDYGFQVRQTLVFDIAKLHIQGDLQASLTGSISRIVILWAQSTYASLILQFALNLDLLGPQFTWILSSEVPLNSFNQTFLRNLIGMLTIEPTVGDVLDKPINTTLLDAAYRIWAQYEPASFPGSAKVNNYALFAFDATWSLIQSLQNLCPTNIKNASSCMSFITSSFCYDNRFLNANSLFNQIIGTRFLGVSGSIQFSANVTNRIAGAYYLARNIQASFNTFNYIPVLQWSDDESWKAVKGLNAIVWPGNLLVPPRDYPTLSNVTLRIGVVVLLPFTMISSNTDENGQTGVKLIGYAPDLINLLQNKMGFIPNIIVAPPNQTYDGLVDAVANGVYDMVVADVTITSARREKAAFSTSIFDNALRIIMRSKTVTRTNLLSFLKPFSFDLWMMLLAAITFAAFLFCLLERFDNQILHNRSLVSSVTMSWWYSIGTIMGYGADFQVVTAAGRLLTVGLYLLSLVLVATYTANLASELTITKSEFVISGIEDIKNRKIPFNRIGIRVGTAAENYFLQEISAGIRSFYPLSSQQEMYNALLNNSIDASFMDSGTTEYITNNVYCNLTSVGSDFDHSSLAIVIPKGWLYEQDLDVNVLELQEAGVLDELKTKWFETSICADNPSDRTGITFETMSGLFLTFAVICALSIILFIWTKRWNMINYLFKLVGRSSPLSKQGTTVTRCTPEPSRRAENFQQSSNGRMVF